MYFLPPCSENEIENGTKDELQGWLRDSERHMVELQKIAELVHYIWEDRQSYDMKQGARPCIVCGHRYNHDEDCAWVEVWKRLEKLGSNDD